MRAWCYRGLLTTAERNPMLHVVRTEAITIVLPCFNEEGNIERTVRDVAAWMENQGLQGEIIVVNDGSTDGTGEILRGMQNTKYKMQNDGVCHGERSRTMTGAAPFLDYARNDTVPLRIITHPTNLGYGAAVRSGCDAATTEWIGFMDSDGQFDPRDFDWLLQCLNTTITSIFPLPAGEGRVRGPSPVSSPHGRGESFDVVVGRRRKRADPFLRRCNAKLFGLLSWITLGIWVRDINCAMKVFRKSAWEKARPTITTGALFNVEFFYNLKRQGILWKQVDVSHYPRRFGQQTGARFWVILCMFRELWVLRRQ